MVYFFLFPERDFMYSLTKIHWTCPLMVRVGSALHLVFGNIQQVFNILHIRNILIIDFIFHFGLWTWNQVSHPDISKNYLYRWKAHCVKLHWTTSYVISKGQVFLGTQRRSLSLELIVSVAVPSPDWLPREAGQTLQLISHPFTTGKEISHNA